MSEHERAWEQRDAGGMNRWMPFWKPKPGASLRLFCLPYAGGGASTYYSWIGKLAPDIDVVPIQLPGKETRLAERPPSTLTSLIALLVAGLRPLLDRPFALYGHSMGALIAFELARWLRATRAPEPRHLLVGGRRAPQMKKDDPPLHLLPESDFVEEIRRLDGTPAEVLDDPDLMRLLLPGLRADFALCETYEYRAGIPLDCPITVFGGLEDPDVCREHLDGWREQTRARTAIHELAGGHFFLHTARATLLHQVREELGPTLAKLSA